MKERIKVLDFLRGIAIILVMLRHSGLSTITTRMGWIGVDLFFVLSGFLVSGLLFSEYQKTNRIRPVRFLIRRGFKIYPLFYTTLILHIIYFLVKDIALHWNEVLPEIFFYQNYRPGIIGITWSLAIEEHFYLLLSICMLILYKSGKLKSKKFLPALILFVALSCLLLRIIAQSTNTGFDSYKHFFPTHLRIDSLAFGVLIAWLYFFERKNLFDFSIRYKLLLLIVAVGLISPTFLLEAESIFITTAGFTMLYLGFGILLVLMLLLSNHKPEMLRKPGIVNTLFTSIAWVGVYSYSVYLIHMKAGPMLSNFVYYSTGGFIPNAIIVIFSLGFNIFTGWVLTMLIEKPFLRLREKYFPASEVKA